MMSETNYLEKTGKSLADSPILNIENLVGYYKGSFGTVYAVENVSLSVDRGEIVGIAGESGSGKSTLAELISGVPRPLLHYESGLINIKGYDIYQIDPQLLRSEVLSQIIGYVPQASMNSLNPVIKIKHLLLDVMKQRTQFLYGPARKAWIINHIMVESFSIYSKLEIFDKNLMMDLFVKFSILLHKKPKALCQFYQIIQKITISEQFRNKKLGLNDKITVLFDNFLHFLQENQNFLQQPKIKKKFKKKYDNEIIAKILYESFKLLEKLDIKKEILDLLNIIHTSGEFKKLFPQFELILRGIPKEICAKLAIPESWWEILWNKPEIPKKDDVLEQAVIHFEKLGLSKKVLDLYPHELSGGMKQRTVIAISTLWNPKLLIVDEPTSALDVSTQKRLLDLFLYLKEKKIVETIIFISHDIPTLRQICSRCIIMYGGQLVEDADMDTIIERPLHPYTESLVKSIVSFNPDGTPEEELITIHGKPPDLREPPSGCRFHPRCPKSLPICSKKDPETLTIKNNQNGSQHRVKCWLYHETDLEVK